MSKTVLGLVIALCVMVVALASCSAPEPGQTAPRGEEAAADTSAARDELVSEWLELAKTSTREDPKIAETSEVAGKLAGLGWAAFGPLMDVMADPQSDPATKVLASLSIREHLTVEMIPRIIEMTQEGNDATTRACATDVLGFMREESAQKRLAELRDAPDRRVRFLAYRGLVFQDVQNAQAREDLQKLWRQPDATPEERGHIVLALINGPALDSVWLLKEAVQDQKIAAQARLLAVRMLGRVGDKDCIEALTSCLEKEPNEEVRAATENAIASIKERPEGSGVLTLPIS